eukprot:gene26767-32344_t
MKSLLQSAAKKAGKKFREAHGITSSSTPSPPPKLFPSSPNDEKKKETSRYSPSTSPSRLASQAHTPTKPHYVDNNEVNAETTDSKTNIQTDIFDSSEVDDSHVASPSAWQDILLLKTLSGAEKGLVMTFFFAVVYVQVGNLTLESCLQVLKHFFGESLPQTTLYIFQHAAKNAVGDIVSYIASPDNWPAFLSGSLLGVYASFAFDYDTKTTDESVANAYHTSHDVWTHIRTMIGCVYTQSSESVKRTLDSIQHGVQALQHKVEQTPMVVRYLVGILAGTLIVRYVLGYIYSLATYTVNNHWHTLVASAIGLGAAAAAMAYVHKIVAACRMRQQAVQSVVKAVYLALAHYKESYPVDQMKDEIEHCLRQQQQKLLQQERKDASPVKAAIQFVGDVVNFLASPKPATTLELPEEVIDIYSTIEGVSGAGELEEVWRDALAVIKRERKVRVNEKDVHGVKTKCFTLN